LPQEDLLPDATSRIRAHPQKPGAPFLASFARSGDFERRPRFHYWDKGSLATIGRAAAVAQFGKIHISGFMAWLAWLFVHILFLIGFRNRLLVFIQWAWSYVTYERGARLITGSTDLPGWTGLAPDLHPDRPSEPAFGPNEFASREIHTSVRK
jgi:hypothetical protein